MDDRAELRNIATCQRNVVYCVLIQFCAYLVLNFLFGMHQVVLGLLGFVILIGAAVYSLISVSKLATALSKSSILYIIAMFIPCVSLIALVSIIQQATNRLKAGGVKVGLLGANPDSI